MVGPAAVVLVVGWATNLWVERTREERALVKQTGAVIEALNAAYADLLNAEVGERGYVLTGDSAFLQPYARSAAAIAGDLATLRAMIRDPVRRRRVDVLDSLVTRKSAELARAVVLRRASGLEAARAVVASDRQKRTMEEIRRVVGSMLREEHDLALRRGAVEEQRARVTEAVLVAGTGASAVIALVLNGMLTRYAESEASAARELATRAEALEVQQRELERQARRLQEQAGELETQNEELLTIAETLREQTEAGEAARVAAEQAQAEAQRANTAKTRFLAAMSHELRTPLNAIQGYAELLDLELQGPLTEGQRGYLSRLSSSGQHLLALIDDLLDLGRIDAGQVKLRPRAVAIDEILRTVEGIVGPVFDAKGVMLTWPQGGAAATVYADPERVQQILVNLLTNACKFTSAGGGVAVDCVTPCFEDEPRRAQAGEREAVAIRVSDTGRGIAPEHLASIFEPFVQIDSHLTKASQRGVGLGLAIARTLARQMGGDLTVESALGRGTSFTLTLPFVAAGVRTPSAV